MKSSVVVAFCLLIVTLLASMHVFFKDSISPVDSVRQKLVKVEKERRATEFRRQLLAQELQDYQQHVATLLPEALKGRGNDSAFPLRQLASVASGPLSEMLTIERASGLFEDAKTAFRKEEFDESGELLIKLINLYPTSQHIPEAHFLLAEGQYRQKEYPQSITTIEKMIDLFPENELTGFALLRLAHIFESQDRLEDAGDIYRAVIANFHQDVLLRQAKASLQAVAQ